MHTPGHTSGSITFFDKENHYGFSGDAFGSTNLLLFAGPFKTLINTCTRAAEYMQKNGMSQEVLSGKRKGTPDSANGLNRSVTDFGVTIRYNDPDALK